MIIYGAGLAGLVTAHVLRRHRPVIYEAQATLPHNHEALLRFRTDLVSRACGIPFREVEVVKSICYKGRTIKSPDIKLNNLYSYKVTGEYHARSIGNTTDCKRFIAPPDFVAQLARGVEIQFGRQLTSLDQHMDAPPVISTIPMPALMSLARWENKPVFKYKTIWSAWCEITSPVIDLYQTIYYPDPELPYYRASITGSKVIVEFGVNDQRAICAHFEQILYDFGILYQPSALKDILVKEQRYGKLLPIDDSVRRKFIVAMTDEYRIYSIGRFATWRQILMDDVVVDAERLDKWITDRDNAYAWRLNT